MRLVPVLALMTSAFALAACAGGGGGLNGGGTLSAAGIVANNGTSVCGINQTGCIPTPTGGGGGGGTPSPSTGVGSAAGGNVETNVPGNRTIALEQFVLDKPTDPKIPAISQITSTLTPTFADTDAAVISGIKPTSLKFTINTNSPNNSKWAVPAEMPEWVNGTRDLRWIELGHTTVDFNNPAAYVINDTMGNPIRYNFLKNAFEYTVAHIGTDGKFHNKDAIVDHGHDDFYWNKIAVFMGSKANAGSKKNYREYWLF